jgi:DUF4097 and DUF4098 domain-containing protein YvlB
MANWEYPCSGAVDLEVEVTSGSVAITAESTGTCTVDARGSGADDLADRIMVSFDDGKLRVIEPDRSRRRWRDQDLDVTVTVPDASRVTVRTASADVRCDGEPGTLDANTASGDVTVASVGGPTRLTTSSGNVDVDVAGGELVVTSASGRVRVGRATQDVTAKTSSGGITIGAAEGSLNIQSASGRVRINGVTRGHADVNTVSGDIEIRVTPGTGVYLDLASLSGRVSSELEPTDTEARADVHLNCKTVSGAVRIARAVAGQAAS